MEVELTGSGFARALRDQAIVDAQLPALTRVVKADGVRGWVYPVRSRLGDLYQLFLWFDGGAYQVKVLEPATGEERPHACHLFPGGRICLGLEAGGGAPTLEAAYARSVVWANGYSVYQREGAFPF